MSLDAAFLTALLLSTLRQTAVAFVNFPFGHNGDLSAAFRKMKCAGKPGKTTADNNVIKLQNFFIIRHDKKIRKISVKICCRDLRCSVS